MAKTSCLVLLVVAILVPVRPETIELSDLAENEVATTGDDDRDGGEIRMAECHLRPVIHILQRAGCVPKPIPSYACYGTCNSYVQVSNSKFWQVERSCQCCQEIGEREATVTLHCPKQSPQYRKVVTRAPVDCLCRPCTAVDEHQIQPQEMILDSKN